MREQSGLETYDIIMRDLIFNLFLVASRLRDKNIADTKYA